MLNSSLKNGTVKVAPLRKTDVLVMDEFSMLDYHLFCVADCVGSLQRNMYPVIHREVDVILLGDLAQLPAVSRRHLIGGTILFIRC